MVMNYRNDDAVVASSSEEPNNVPNEINLADLELLKSDLANLPSKPRRKRTKVTVKQCIFESYEWLNDAYCKGYTYNELAEFFNKRMKERMKRTITPGTLRKYMNEAAKQKKHTPVSEASQARPALSPRPSLPSSSSAPTALAPMKMSPRESLMTPRSTAHAHESEFENLN